MGLAEKRLIADIEKEVGTVKIWLKEVFGKEIQVETDFDSFEGFSENEKLNRGNRFAGLVHRPIAEALVYNIGKDSLGKSAITESIDGIHFKNVSGDAKVAINNKVMEIAFPFSSSDPKTVKYEVQKLIENNL